MTCSFSSHSVWSPGITPVFATDGSLGIEPWEHQSPGQIQDFSRIHQVRWSQGPMPKVISSSWRICCIRAPKQRMQRWIWHAWMPTRRGRNNLGCSPPCLYLEFALLQVANIKSECIWLMSGIQQWAMQSTHPVPRTKKTCPGARGTFYTGTTWRFADLDCSKTLSVRRDEGSLIFSHFLSKHIFFSPQFFFSAFVSNHFSCPGCRAVAVWFARCHDFLDLVEGAEGKGNICRNRWRSRWRLWKGVRLLIFWFQFQIFLHDDLSFCASCAQGAAPLTQDIFRLGLKSIREEVKWCKGSVKKIAKGSHRRVKESDGKMRVSAITFRVWGRFQLGIGSAPFLTSEKSVSRFSKKNSFQRYWIRSLWCSLALQTFQVADSDSMSIVIVISHSLSFKLPRLWNLHVIKEEKKMEQNREVKRLQNKTLQDAVQCCFFVLRKVL